LCVSVVCQDALQTVQQSEWLDKTSVWTLNSFSEVSLQHM